nr:MAG TPA: hypothetical protein [Caudoviricetes sp.]
MSNCPYFFSFPSVYLFRHYTSISQFFNYILHS